MADASRVYPMTYLSDAYPGQPTNLFGSPFLAASFLPLSPSPALDWTDVGGDNLRPAVPSNIDDRLAGRRRFIMSGNWLRMQHGRSYGTTATHNVTGRNLCYSCAVKALGLQDASPADKLITLMRFQLRR